MKKRKIIQITVLTALFLTLSFASAGTMAGAKTKNGFTYKVTKNQVKIVSCSKNQKRIVIPNKIAGKKVTSLGANVWKKSSKVQTVVLPKYLKTIEKKQADYAWGNIVNLSYHTLEEKIPMKRKWNPCFFKSLWTIPAFFRMTLGGGPGQPQYFYRLSSYPKAPQASSLYYQ